jgi:spermidine/putrescine transport system permease protein
MVEVHGVVRVRRFYDLFLALPAVYLLLLFLAPLALVVVFSFGTTDVLNQPQVGFTWTNYQEVLQSYYLPVVWRTLLYAGVTTGVCVVLGYSVAYYAVRFAGRFGPLIIAAIILPWLVDYLVRIYAWKALLAEDGLLNNVLGHVGVTIHILHTQWAVMGGLVYSYFPLMVLPLYATLSDLDPAQIDAGKDLYGSPRLTFLHVTLPATMPGVVGGCLLVFLPALGDFATAQFLGGPSTTMIGNLITGQFLESGSQTFGSALTVTLIVVLLLGVGLTARFARRGLDRAAGMAS